MKTKKVISSILASTVALSTIIGLAGCGPEKKPDTEQTLEICALDAGYGTEWLTNIIDLFKQQDWVKEKYPELNILTPMINDDQKFIENRIKAGGDNNTIDLMFGTNLYSYAGKDSTGKEWLLDLTNILYDQKVPNENVYYKDKLNDSYLSSFKYRDVTDSNALDQWFFAPWSSGMCGFLYNEDILESLNIAVPNTTDELVAACAKIKDDYKVEGASTEFYCFIQGKDESYWSYPFNIWWAQYEGIEGYKNFYNGIDEGAYSVKIFEQQGRVKALEVYEDILDYEKGYLNPSSSTYEFMTSQTAFLQGLAAFNVNGDWFAREMEGTSNRMTSNGQTPATIKMMKTPIISSIVEKLEYRNGNNYMSDELLSSVIAAIDAGEEGYEGVSAADFDKLKEARTVLYSIGPNHFSVIPNYAKGKDVAVDFLLFMATDIAQEAYIKGTKGADLPFEYNWNDLETRKPDVYNSISVFQHSRLDYVNSKSYTPYTLPMPNSFPLVKFGSLMPFVETNYYETFAKHGNTKTPKDFYDETLRIWTAGKFSSALAASGIEAR